MATINKFEALEIWQLAREVCRRVYPLSFEEPIKKDYRYRDQLREICGAIMDNLAEGFGRGSKPGFIHSHTIAKGEELKWQLYGGTDIGFCLKHY